VFLKLGKQYKTCKNQGTVYGALTIREWLCTWPRLLRPECHAVCYVCVLHSLSDSIVSVQYSTALLCECKAILSNDLIVPGRLIDWSQTMLLKVKSSYRSTGIQIREWFLHYSLQWDHIVWTIIPWIGEITVTTITTQSLSVAAFLGMSLGMRGVLLFQET